MRDIPIAANHYLAATIYQRFQVRHEANHHAELESLPLFTAGTGG